MKIEWEKLLNNVLTVEGSLGNTYNRFYNYSLLNRIHFMMQGIKEPVATYKKWNSLGRKIKKGSKAKYVVRPQFFKDKVTDQSVLGGFVLQNSIFSYSDTEGPEISFDHPVWNKELAFKTLNINQIDYNSVDGNTQGYAVIGTRNFAINPMAVCPMKTMFHEIAHIILGHTQNDDEDMNRGIKEFQAETVAHIVMVELGLDFNCSESRAYVQGWLNDTRPTPQQISAVFKAVDTIITAGKAEQDEKDS
jgi:antirestriction protein ArdC